MMKTVLVFIYAIHQSAVSITLEFDSNLDCVRYAERLIVDLKKEFYTNPMASRPRHFYSCLPKSDVPRETPKVDNDSR